MYIKTYITLHVYSNLRFSAEACSKRKTNDDKLVNSQIQFTLGYIQMEKLSLLHRGILTVTFIKQTVSGQETPTGNSAVL